MYIQTLQKATARGHDIYSTARVLKIYPAKTQVSLNQTTECGMISCSSLPKGNLMSAPAFASASSFLAAMKWGKAWFASVCCLNQTALVWPMIRSHTWYDSGRGWHLYDYKNMHPDQGSVCGTSVTSSCYTYKCVQKKSSDHMILL